MCVEDHRWAQLQYVLSVFRNKYREKEGLKKV